LTKVKVLFELDPEDWHGHGAETLWAELASSSDGGCFRPLNSPFFARGVSYEDVVEATFIEGSHLVFQFKDVAERSGHSTFMMLSERDEPRFESYWSFLQKAGCTYEDTDIGLSIGRRRLRSVDVTPSADLQEVQDFLARGEHAKVWMFQEGYAHVPSSK
jgi:hypothetical protein